MFKTCFVARVEGVPRPRAYICCRFDPDRAWRGPAPENLLSFCFPLGVENVQPREYMRPEEFSFTLTGGDGSRLHGFCRRTLPPRKAPAKPAAGPASKAAMLRYPQVLCIVSQHPWFPFFYKALELVEKMLRQEDLGTASGEAWPPASPALLFLESLLAQVPAQPQLGTVVRVPLPATELPLDFSPPRRALTRGTAQSPLLHADSGAVELEVPPDLGLGPENAGISAARLLFHLPPRVALTLVAALLLERRIILVASAEDKVSAAVHAAAALVYPFRWQHIYLPLLPMALKDYLAAPMPYLVGLNSACLPMLRSMALEEVLLVDLDLGECMPPPDSARDDAFLLPYAPKLLSALETCKDGTLSATEFNSTPFIASVMQEYFLKLVGKYRLFIQPDPGSPRGPAAKNGRNGQGDDIMRAHGFAFDQAAFVAQHKNAGVREFLQQFRHSQMFEVFISERLRMAAKGSGPQDAFEQKVAQLMSKHASFGGGGGGGGLGGAAVPSQGSGRFASMLKKTANAMRQSSDSLMKGLKQLGSTQDEYAAMPRRATSSFSGLQRISPLAPPASPGGGLKGHSRTPSFSNLQVAGGRAASFTNLHRTSPVPGSHMRPAASVNLDDVKPDLFFGDVEDDGASEASDGSQPRSGNSSPGPVDQQGTARNRTFPSLFRLGNGHSAAASPRVAVLQRDTSGKSSSSPSLVSLDVSAGPSGSHLIDLSGPEFSAQAPAGGAGAAAGLAPAQGPPELPHVQPRPALRSSGSSFGAGGFGSPVLRKPSNLGQSSSAVGSPMAGMGSSSHSGSAGSSGFEPKRSPLVPASSAPSGEAALSILGALSRPATLPARQSTGSSGSEWAAFSASSVVSERQPMVGAPLRGSGGAAAGGAAHAGVRADAFGSLLADVKQQVDQELVVRRRTSSQDHDVAPVAAASASAATSAASPPARAGYGGSAGAAATASAAFASACPAAELPQPENGWADFTSSEAAVGAAPSGPGHGAGPASCSSRDAAGAGPPQQLTPSRTLSWSDWSGPPPQEHAAAGAGGQEGRGPEALAAELAERCSLAVAAAPGWAGGAAGRQQDGAAMRSSQPGGWGAFMD